MVSYTELVGLLINKDGYCTSNMKTWLKIPIILSLIIAAFLTWVLVSSPFGGWYSIGAWFSTVLLLPIFWETDLLGVSGGAMNNPTVFTLIFFTYLVPIVVVFWTMGQIKRKQISD